MSCKYCLSGSRWYKDDSGKYHYVFINNVLVKEKCRADEISENGMKILEFLYGKPAQYTSAIALAVNPELKITSGKEPWYLVGKTLASLVYHGFVSKAHRVNGIHRIPVFSITNSGALFFA